jgi:hypothetical protein
MRLKVTAGRMIVSSIVPPDSFDAAMLLIDRFTGTLI